MSFSSDLPPNDSIIKSYLNRLTEIEGIVEGSVASKIPVFGRIFKWINYREYRKEIKQIVNNLVNEKAILSRCKEHLSSHLNGKEWSEIWKTTSKLELMFANPALGEKIHKIETWAFMGRPSTTIRKREAQGEELVTKLHDFTQRLEKLHDQCAKYEEEIAEHGDDMKKLNQISDEVFSLLKNLDREFKVDDPTLSSIKGFFIPPFHEDISMILLSVSEKLEDAIDKEISKIRESPNSKNLEQFLSVTPKFDAFFSIYRKIQKLTDIKSFQNIVISEKKDPAIEQLQRVKAKLNDFFYRIEPLYLNYQFTKASQAAKELRGKPIEQRNISLQERAETIVIKSEERKQWWLHHQPDHRVSKYLQDDLFISEAKENLNRMISATGDTIDAKLDKVRLFFRAFSISFKLEDQDQLFETLEAAYLSCPEELHKLSLMLGQIDRQEIRNEKNKLCYDKLTDIISLIETGTGLPEIPA